MVEINYIRCGDYLLPNLMSTLKTHLAQFAIRKKNAAVYKKYMQLDPKKRGVYMKKHAGEIEQHESTTKYLKDHLNGYGKIPEKGVAGRTGRANSREIRAL